MSGRRRFRFRLTFGREEYLAYYAGTARWVVARSYEGETVRFPASFLREFVSEDGVNGTFEMIVDGNDKLISIRKLTPSS
jgi:hypothetical protein